VRGPFFVVILAVLLARLTLCGLGDTAISVAHTSIPDNRTIHSVSETGYSLATVRLR